MLDKQTLQILEAEITQLGLNDTIEIKKEKSGLVIVKSTEIRKMIKKLAD